MREKALDSEHDQATRTDFVRRVTMQLNDMARKGKSRADRERAGVAMENSLSAMLAPSESLREPGVFECAVGGVAVLAAGINRNSLAGIGVLPNFVIALPLALELVPSRRRRFISRE